MNLFGKVKIFSLLMIGCLLVTQLPTTHALAQEAETAPGLFQNVKANEAAKKPRTAKTGRSVRASIDFSWLQSEQIVLNLLDDTSVTAIRDRFVDNVSGNLVWLGHIEGQPLSQVTLAIRNGVMAGSILHGNSRYEIVADGEGQYLIYEVDEANLPPHQDPIPVHVPPTANDIMIDPAIAQAGNVVDLLIVYTPASRTRLGGQASIESQIVSAVQTANQAFINSSVNMQLNIVAMAETNHVETGDMSLALSRLQNSNDGFMDEVHTLRNSVGADLVAMVSEDTSACGLGYVMQSVSTGFATWAFSVVYSGCLSSYSLTHEIGHNVGNAHDRANAGVTGAYPYSYGYRRCVTDGTGFSTVMAYTCSGANRINYFANPNVTYSGNPTGVHYESDPANAADTARSMNNTAATVAAFRTSILDNNTIFLPSAPDNLTASAISSSQINIAWSDMSDNETGFKIERSLNNSTWTEIANVASDVTSYINAGLNASTLYYYRIHAYNSAGNADYSNVASATTKAPSVITLGARAYIAQRKKYADLTWSGAQSSNVAIYRNNALITTTVNDGKHTDLPSGKTTSFTYKICEAGTTLCSNSVTVTY